jgi:thiol:disulfide interchange protein
MNSARSSSLVLGIVILAIGVWYFADRTLGLNLPRLSWDQLWPLALVAFGIWIIAGPYLRRR